jgi:hypothetical protein
MGHDLNIGVLETRWDHKSSYSIRSLLTFSHIYIRMELTAMSMSALPAKELSTTPFVM